MHTDYETIKEYLKNLDNKTLMKIVQEAKDSEPEDAPDIPDDSVTDAVISEILTKIDNRHKNSEDASYHIQILMMTEAAFRWHDYQLTINSVAH